MAYSVLISGQIAADHIDAYVKSAVSSTPVENGNIVQLTQLVTNSGYNEVYYSAMPSDITSEVYYMVDEPVNVLVNSIYSGLIDDPRDFNIAADKVFRITKPQVGDEIIISEDGVTGTQNTYAIPAASTNVLAFSASTSSATLVYQYIQTTTIAVGNTHVTAYKFLCTAAS